MQLAERRGDDRDPNRPNGWDERQARVDASVGPNKRQRVAETYKELLDDETERMWRLDEELRRPFVHRFNPNIDPHLSPTFASSERSDWFGGQRFLPSHPSGQVPPFLDLTHQPFWQAGDFDMAHSQPYLEYNFENVRRGTYPSLIAQMFSWDFGATRSPLPDAEHQRYTTLPSGQIVVVDQWHAAFLADRLNPPVAVSDDFEIYRDEVEVIVEAEEEPDSDATPAYSPASSEY